MSWMEAEATNLVSVWKRSGYTHFWHSQNAQDLCFLFKLKSNSSSVEYYTTHYFSIELARQNFKELLLNPLSFSKFERGSLLANDNGKLYKELEYKDAD